MLPLKLTLEGIYSYQEAQTIDFRNLTDAGLFGIFGETGSGKSTILEAISYALYGETERMHSRDNRAYNMMNLKSNRLYIEFDFLNAENKKFRATKEIKRNRNHFDKTSPQTSNLYEEINGEWIPITEKIEDILGLTYANFKRTIIIPQGQFKEFIELGEKDRTTMLKEIFDLERFDLQDNIRTLNTENYSKLNEKQGELNAFEHYTDELLENLKKAEVEAKELLAKTKEDFEVINTLFQTLKSQKDTFEDLAKKRSIFTDLERKLPEFEQKEKELNSFERISKIFTPLLESKKQLDFKKKDLATKVNQKQLEFDQNNQKLTEITSELAKIEHYFNNLGQKRKEETDLKAIQAILIAEQTIQKISNDSKALKNQQEEQIKLLEAVKKELIMLDSEIKEETKHSIDSGILIEISTWFQKRKNYQEQLLKSQKTVAEIEANKAVELKSLAEFGVNLENYQSYFEEKERGLQQEKINTEKTLRDLEVQQKFADHAHTLEDGSPCPLCGSEEHPNILSEEDVSVQITQANHRLEEIETQFQNWNAQKTSVGNSVSKIQVIESQLTNAKDELTLIEQTIAEHNKQFNWKDFDSSNEAAFEAKKSEILQNESKIKRKRVELDEKRQNQAEIEEKLKQIEKSVSAYLLEETKNISARDTNLKLLSVLDFKDYKNHSSAEISQKLNDLKIENDKIEKDYQEFSKIIHELKPIIAGLQAELNGLKENLKTFENELNEIENQIEKELTTENLTFSTVEQTLEKPKDITQERKEIEEFKITFNSLKIQIDEVSQKVANIDYNEEKFKEIEQKYVEFTQKLEETTKNHTKQEAELTRVTIELEKKKVLETEMEKLKNRATNLNEMLNLFKGAAFVNFISSIYLRQLCDVANQRFQRMTKNQLSLILNDKNEFEVIDYLNEGRLRSVKTLSGGQSFQVSLSLALALAESVQTKFKTDKNFFFIDEGFGTQDGDAVNLVFETLLNLNKENKVVGIISHVEELKDRIPYSLIIEKDQEKGSLIRERR